jgi:hypothetical protein
MSDEKDTRADQGVKFSQFTKVTPDPAKNIQMVGLRDNKNVRADLTTDLVSTNSSVVFRDSKGRFKSAKDVPELNNQLEVNRFLWNAIEGLLAEPEAPELPSDRLPIYAEDEPTEYPYAEDGEPNDLEVDDQWYKVEDPSFDYDNPDPEGLDLYIWTPTEDDATVFEWVLFVAEAPDGVVIIKDEAPDPEEDEVGNGSLWFDNSQDTMQLYVWHEDSDAWIPVAPPTTLEGRVSQGEATQQAIIAQITVALEEQTSMRNKLAEVEQTVDALEPANLDGLASTEYVDSKAKRNKEHIDALQLDVGYRMHATWKYNNTAEAEELANGEFTIRTDSNDPPVMKIYLAGKDTHGRKWYAHSDDNSSFTHAMGAQYCSITDRDGEVRKAGKLTEVTFNNGDNQYARLWVQWYKSNWALSAGNYYTINAAGLLPHAHYIDHYEHNQAPRTVAQASNKEKETADVVIGSPMEGEE